ncbi:MAG: hypothetical protein GXO99_00805 [Nitrospirae bacterium]|nr:hypothetical protein [Nitrospirota bacterium]
MKKGFYYLLIASLLLTACQPSTFLISKGNRAYYFGRQSKSLKKILCDSGDFKKVLRNTRMPEHLKDDFYRYVCTDEASREKVVALYNFLTPDERKSLKRAFVKQGYAINYVPC